MKSIYRIIGFGVFLLLVLWAAARLFDTASVHDMRSKARWILSRRGGKYDFAVLGSSRSYVGIDISVLEKKLGGNGINLSLNGTTFPEQYLALRLFLRHNEIKHLILDANPMELDNSAFKFPFHAYGYLQEVRDPEVFRVLRDNFGQEAFAWRYVPFYKNAQFNTEIGVSQVGAWLKSRRNPQAKVAEFDQHGTWLMSPAKKDPKFQDNVLRNMVARTLTIDNQPKKYYFEVLKLAREKGIRVTLITLPEYYLSKHRYSNCKEIMDFYETAAATNGIPFLQFDDDEICRDKSKFADAMHLCREGAIEFSERLASRLANGAAVRIPR